MVQRPILGANSKFLAFNWFDFILFFLVFYHYTNQIKFCFSIIFVYLHLRLCNDLPLMKWNHLLPSELFLSFEMCVCVCVCLFTLFPYFLAIIITRIMMVNFIWTIITLPLLVSGFLLKSWNVWFQRNNFHFIKGKLGIPHPHLMLLYLQHYIQWILSSL